MSGIRVWAGVAAVSLAMSLGVACDDPEIDEGPPADEAGVPAEEEPSVDGDGRIIFEDVAEEAEGRPPAEGPEEDADAEEAPAEPEEVEEADEGDDGEDEE